MFRAHEVYDVIESIFIEIILNLYEVVGLASQPFFKAGFSLAVVGYMLFVFKTGIGTAGYKTLLTGLLLTMNFQFITNLSSYEGYLVSLVFDTPKEFAEFFMSANAHSLGLSTPEQTDMSQLYGSIFSNLIERAGDDELWSMYLPSFKAVLIYVAALSMFASYMMYWLVQFAFLFNILAYMVLSPIVIMLSAFNETRQVFFEWLRSVVTYMLYPVIATAIIYVINEMIFKLVLDGQYIENNQSPFPSGVIILISLIACASFSKVAEIANSLTRGSVSGKGSNPFEVGKSAINSTVKGASIASKAIQGTIGAGYGAVDMAQTAGSAIAQGARKYNDMMRSDSSTGASNPEPPTVSIPHVPDEAYRTGDHGLLPTPVQPEPYSPQQFQETGSQPSQDATSSQKSSTTTSFQSSNQTKTESEQNSKTSQQTNQDSSSNVIDSMSQQASQDSSSTVVDSIQEMPQQEYFEQNPNQQEMPPLDAYMPPEYFEQNPNQQEMPPPEAYMPPEHFEFGNPMPKEKDIHNPNPIHQQDQKEKPQPNVTL